MTVQLSKAQLDAIKVELAQYGLEVRQARAPRKAAKPESDLFLPKSKWYRGKRYRGLPYTQIGEARMINFPWLWNHLVPVKGLKQPRALQGRVRLCPSNDPRKIAAYYADPARVYLNTILPPRLMLTYQPEPTLV